MRQGHKRYRKGLKEKAPTIKNAISIDEHPPIVDSQERYGDWEIDTVLGKHGTGAIVTILERKGRFYLATKLPSKSADAVTKATIKMLMPYKDCVYTLLRQTMEESSRVIKKLEVHWMQKYILLIHIALGSEVQTKTQMAC